MIYNSFTSKFIKYGFIGISALCIELILFFIFTNFFNILLSNSISLFLSIFYSYFMNLKFNFKYINNFIFGALKFYITCIVGLCLSNLIIYILLFYIDKVFLIKLISVPPVVFFQFVLNYFWTFKQNKS